MTNVMIQGADKLIDIYYRDENGKPLDLSGGTVDFEMALAANPASPSLQVSTTTYLDKNGVSHPLDSKGKATIHLTEGDISGLASGTYKADAKVTDANNFDSISQTYTYVVKARRS